MQAFKKCRPVFCRAALMQYSSSSERAQYTRGVAVMYTNAHDWVLTQLIN